MMLAGVGAVVAAVVAVLAWLAAVKSANAAQQSAETAQATLELQRAEAARARERVDVKWERVNIPETAGAGSTPGMTWFANVGTTPAYAVRAVVQIGGVPHEAFADEIPPGMGLSISLGADVPAQARITWRSELGTPDMQVVE